MGRRALVPRRPPLRRVRPSPAASRRRAPPGLLALPHVLHERLRAAAVLYEEAPKLWKPPDGQWPIVRRCEGHFDKLTLAEVAVASSVNIKQRFSWNARRLLRLDTLCTEIFNWCFEF